MTGIGKRTEEQEATMNNVGTANYPVSWLHQRAVALLYDEISVALANSKYEVRARLEPGGELSHDLSAKVMKVKVPGEWDSVGGVVPDLILYGYEDQPIRIVEIIVTAPPKMDKRKKLDQLVRRGIDVVEIKLKSADDLLTLCWTPSVPKFSGLNIYDRFSINIPKNQALSQIKIDSNRRVEEFGEAIMNCSPEVRRKFVEVLDNVSSLESLFPVRPDNPLKSQLAVGCSDEVQR